MRVRSILLLISWVVPVGANAVDGVMELNQTCAAVGCFAGDSPGFPITIGSPGSSYRLTSSLSPAPNPNLNAIEISAPLVTIDLNGFAIIGPSSYSGGGGGSCVTPGTGVGVTAVPNAADSVAVSNGSVRGMPSHGIALGSSSRVERVIAEQNCGAGITVGFGSTVIDSVARKNGGNGIVLDRASRVSDSVADFNGGTGIRNINGDVLVESCTANANGGDGINVGSRSLVRGNIANGNQDDGLQLGAFSLVLDNLVVSNTDWGLSGNSEGAVGQTAGFNNGGPDLGFEASWIGCNVSSGFLVECPSHP